MSTSALIAEGHVHRPPVCIRHLAPSKGAPWARRDMMTLPSAASKNAKSRFYFSLHWARGTSGMGLGWRQFSLTCPAAAALKCFLGLVWKQDSVLGFKEDKVLMETTLLLVRGSNQRGLGGQSGGSQTVNSFKAQKRLESHAQQQNDMLPFSGILDTLHIFSFLIGSSELIEELWAIDLWLITVTADVGSTAFLSD